MALLPPLSRAAVVTGSVPAPTPTPSSSAGRPSAPTRVLPKHQALTPAGGRPPRGRLSPLASCPTWNIVGGLRNPSQSTSSSSCTDGGLSSRLPSSVASEVSGEGGERRSRRNGRRRRQRHVSASPRAMEEEEAGGRQIVMVRGVSGLMTVIEEGMCGEMSPGLQADRYTTTVKYASSPTPSPTWHLPVEGRARDVAFASLGASATLAMTLLFSWIGTMVGYEHPALSSAAIRGDGRGSGAPGGAGAGGAAGGVGIGGAAAPPSAAMPETDAGRKESVEWVNMVLHKVWKVYRRSLETWLVGLLQPAIDKLPKPDYVKRVKIMEFSLDYEPLSVRNVQRRASRRANDLQYHVGLRYTGGARCLLSLTLKKGAFETEVPVGVYDLDVDAELWVKLRLAPVKPYIGTVSLAFVRLPTIKLVLAPFRIVNLFAIPFLSRFLSKLLTIDLPKLFVLPRHITFDFLPHDVSNISPNIMDLVRNEMPSPTVGSVEQTEANEAFVGELSVTLCEGRNLPIRGLTGWSNPYCTLGLGTQIMESKRNNETSAPAGRRDPVWNQDFQFLVEDPKRQFLMVRIRDSSLTLNPNIGFCKIPIWKFQDCVPVNLWVPLKREGPIGVHRVPGELRLQLTYKSFVDEEEKNNAAALDHPAPYIKVYGKEEDKIESGEESVCNESDCDLLEQEENAQNERGERPSVPLKTAAVRSADGEYMGKKDNVQGEAQYLEDSDDDDVVQTRGKEGGDELRDVSASVKPRVNNRVVNGKRSPGMPVEQTTTNWGVAEGAVNGKRTPGVPFEQMATSRGEVKERIVNGKRPPGVLVDHMTMDRGVVREGVVNGKRAVGVVGLRERGSSSVNGGGDGGVSSVGTSYDGEDARPWQGRLDQLVGHGGSHVRDSVGEEAMPSGLSDTEYTFRERIRAVSMMDAEEGRGDGHQQVGFTKRGARSSTTQKKVATLHEELKSANMVLRSWQRGWQRDPEPGGGAGKMIGEGPTPPGDDSKLSTGNQHQHSSRPSQAEQKGSNAEKGEMVAVLMGALLGSASGPSSELVWVGIATAAMLALAFTLHSSGLVK
ncbi:hypothetical protein CBR_g19924 [Chara braunii]|uniref:C2 domain-containing protein n=1 Tax=Chara braunii TaxID=69332 RepID=A0A388KZ26_CHABU|nr:hypothetical protein CBR_g19924 [Chara braunii]|eukprot:GBG75291.1 hypothetical protein CBR_g19924 [Chara braunii]